MVELNRQFYPTLVITDFHQFKSYRSLFLLPVESSAWMTSWTHLASDWLAVSADGDPSINVYEMRFSRGEINDYYSIYTNDDVTLFIHYDYTVTGVRHHG